ncbi:DUF445 domain-containing protein [Litoribacillus peritrichatus]|uniref:DUF445 family protein n=1 Tax=Litoribacillus peritrichatus TaxID=718191 RepID=A0ABP7N6J3_9GAMM
MELHEIWLDLQNNPHYLLMPLIAGFVGYITKVLALEMMFLPVEFKGIKPYFGWQGVVPRKADKMAGSATDLLLSRLLTLEELIDRLDIQRMVNEVEQHLKLMTDRMIRDVGDNFVPEYWHRLPNFAQYAVIKRIQKEIPDIAEAIWLDIRKDPNHYIDIKHLLVSNLVKDKALLNKIFRQIGAKEFVFFRNAGFWFGLVLGVVQLGCWLVWHQPWLMPLFGGTVGLFSDWLALTLLFRPLNKIRIFGFDVQGKFIARQQEVAKDYATLIAKELLTPANMIEEVMRGPSADRLVDLIQKHVEVASEEQLGRARPLVKYALGSERFEEIRSYVVEKSMEMLPETSRHVEAYAMDALDINNTIIARMDQLTPKEFEGLLRPAFKEDEKTLIVAGAALGFLIGELQVQVML